jgi:mannose-binding lectin 2
MLVALVVVCAALASGFEHEPTGYVYHDHSIARPYDGVHDRAHWSFFGSTIVSDRYIRLTPDRQSRRGSLWNTVPFNPPTEEEFPSWEMTLEFHVHGSGKKLFGDGFAVWYTRDYGNEGPVFGNQDKVASAAHCSLCSLREWESFSTPTATCNRATTNTSR